MSAARSSVVCDRIRSQISVELDGEFSQLERAMLAAHLSRCGDCRAYRAEVAAFTRVLRDAPLERLESPIVVRRPRRLALAAMRVPAGVAAALALAVVGVASQLAVYQPPEAARGERLASPSRFPTQAELQSEQRLLQVVATSGSVTGGARDTVR